MTTSGSHVHPLHVKPWLLRDQPGSGCPDCLARDNLITELVGALEKAGRYYHSDNKHHRWSTFEECDVPACPEFRTALSHARNDHD